MRERPPYAAAVVDHEAMSYLATVPEGEADGPAAQLYADDLADQGYVANYTKTFSHRPEVYAGWGGLLEAIRSNISKRRYEVATVAAAHELRSSYCSLAHGRILSGLIGEAAVLELAADDLGDPTTEDVAVAQLAVKVARGAADVVEADYEPLRALGLDDQEILDIVLVVAARCFFSTVLDATGTQPDSAYRSTVSEELRDVLTVGRPIAEGGASPFTIQ